MTLWTTISTAHVTRIAKTPYRNHLLEWFSHHTAASLTIAGALLPGVATIFLVWATKTEGKRNHLSNRHLIESNRHLINLQYRANVYKDVVQFMAETRYQMRRRHKALQDRIADQDFNFQQPPEVNREELSVFVALELHASTEALKAYFDWDDNLTTCMDLFHKLVNHDHDVESKNRSEKFRIDDLTSLASQTSKLHTSEKAFLETVKREVAL